MINSWSTVPTIPKSYFEQNQRKMHGFLESPNVHFEVNREVLVNILIIGIVIVTYIFEIKNDEN